MKLMLEDVLGEAVLKLNLKSLSSVGRVSVFERGFLG